MKEIFTAINDRGFKMQLGYKSKKGNILVGHIGSSLVFEDKKGEYWEVKGNFKIENPLPDVEQCEFKEEILRQDAEFAMYDY